MKTSLTLLAIALMTPALGHAASFDCAKAVTPMEKAICGDKELSAHDEELNAAYGAALSGISKAAKKEMVWNQRHWLDFVQKLCKADAISQQKIELDCLKAQYAERMDILKLVKHEGGLKFYTHDTYLVKDSHGENASWWHMTTVIASYPVIDGPRDLAFNELSEQASVDWPTTRTGTDYRRFMTVEKVLPHLIVLKRNIADYPHGVAHTDQNVSYAYYFRDQERELYTSDIFDPKVPARNLNSMIDPKWDDEHRYSNKNYLVFNDMSQWVIDEKGITFLITPRVLKTSNDRVPVFLSWEKLKPYLQPDALALFAN